MITHALRLLASCLIVITIVGCKASAPQSCRDNSGCSPVQYCAFTPGLCGKGKRAGTCRQRPRACDGLYRPVCGCDKRVYANECEASAAGIDLSVAGGCNDEPRLRDWIGCGARFCDAHKNYCEIILSDVLEPPTDHTCKPLPPACVPQGDVARSCSCFPRETRCVSFCGYIDNRGVKGFHLTCRL